MFPAGMFPQVPINDKKMYPVYACRAELGIAVFVCAGIPGPRARSPYSNVELIDEVLRPELMLDLAAGEAVDRPGRRSPARGGQPVLLDHAFASATTEAIVDFANTRGVDKVIYAGYFPMGLSLERIMGELPGVGFKDEVWPASCATTRRRSSA